MTKLDAIDRNLLRLLQEDGRRTTARFLDLYGLESLDDLPQVDRPL